MLIFYLYLPKHEFLKNSYIHEKHEFLNYFYTYLKQKSLKKIIHLKSYMKVLRAFASQKASVTLYL